jgi:hypothetical protein
MTVESTRAFWLAVIAITAIATLAVLLAHAGASGDRVGAAAFSSICALGGFTAGHHLGASGRTTSERRLRTAMKALHEASPDRYQDFLDRLGDAD